MRDLWEPFFTAQVAASAALTGLVFVALSINLARIMQYSQLVHRAAEAVALLGQPIAVGLALLAPYRSMLASGLLAAVPALACAALVSRLLMRDRGVYRERPVSEFRTRTTLAVFALVPGIIGAPLLLADQTSGFGFLAFGVVACIGVGIIDAWILLVEILR